MGILNLYACVAYPQCDDEYLTDNSYKFHEHLGFAKTGEFHKCGYKFGRWYDMVWMEKLIVSTEKIRAPSDSENGLFSELYGAKRAVSAGVSRLPTALFSADSG